MARERPPRRQRRDADAIHQIPWRQPVNRLRPVEVLSGDQLEAIHEASLKVLEDIGFEVLNPRALELYRRAGATVDTAAQRVRLDRGLVAAAIGTAPGPFTVHARNPDRNVIYGEPYIAFACVGGPPNCSDLDGGRRPGNQKDFRDLLRLCQSLNAVHVVGAAVAPIDLDAETRHLDMYYDYLTLSDRVWHASGLGATRIADAMEMVCIARGIDRDRLAREPSLATVINTNSPLRLDGPMADGLMTAAAAGQAVVLTPFTLAGAMAPISLAGALTQQNAEALAGVTLTQLVRPGAPVMYGGFTSNVDMRSGAPAFGTPEYVKATLATGQLARRYGLPYRSSNVNASNAVDAQAAYESQMAIWGSVLGHANLLLHGVGWLEGGLVASFEKMVVDAEMLQMIAVTLEPIEVNDDTLALSAMAEVGPGGHFFGAAHTLQHYETAFYTPLLSDWRNFEAWRAAGALSATERANGIYKTLLARFEPPPIDKAVDEALRAFVARRKREIASQARD
jgi:trimethylamine--corrinoid protein Co-methyltransferase